MKQRHVSAGVTQHSAYAIDRIDDIGHRAVKSDASPVQQDNARGDHLTDEVEIVLNDQDAQPLACHQVRRFAGCPLCDTSGDSITTHYANDRFAPIVLKKSFFADD